MRVRYLLPKVQIHIDPSSEAREHVNCIWNILLLVLHIPSILILPTHKHQPDQHQSQTTERAKGREESLNYPISLGFLPRRCCSNQSVSPQREKAISAARFRPFPSSNSDYSSAEEHCLRKIRRITSQFPKSQTALFKKKKKLRKPSIVIKWEAVWNWNEGES